MVNLGRSQELHNTQSFHYQLALGQCNHYSLKWNLKYPNTIIFLRKVSRATSPVWLSGSYDCISSTTSAPSIRVTKLSINLKAKLPIIYLLRHKWCAIREHGKTQLVYCIISKTKTKNLHTHNLFAAHSTQLHHKMRYINKK